MKVTPRLNKIYSHRTWAIINDKNNKEFCNILFGHYIQVYNDHAILLISNITRRVLYTAIYGTNPNKYQNAQIW
jgi:hypothetical protein